MLIFSNPSVLAYFWGAQNNHLTEMVLLSTHNICFGLEMRLIFNYTVLSRGHGKRLYGEYPACTIPHWHAINKGCENTMPN